VADKIRITMLGAGNLAWHLAPGLDNCGYAVTSVYSRNIKSAGMLAERLYTATPTDSLDFTDAASDWFFFCVSDDAIAEVAEQVSLPTRATAVHCSGSTSVQALQPSGAMNAGVFYPLQTFSKGNRMDLNGVPILVESDDKGTLSVLSKIGKALSGRVFKVREAERFSAHLAAVFACNFTNHLFKHADLLLQRSGYRLDLLAPLIRETVHKALESGPGNAQTGPARRGDLRILDRHMEYLAGTPAAELYQLLSQQILDDYPEED
jgi:predicted short-subunit dehydrogenase-like oxidoreductase (DUF2520 family)